MASNEVSLINPYTGEVFTTVHSLGEDEVDAVADRAHAAFLEWRHSSHAERRGLCENFMIAIENMRDRIAGDITRQMGKPLRQARNEVEGLLERARHMTAIAESVLADEYLPEKPGFSRYIRHEPKGVVLDIAAWNYPLLIAVNVVVPAVLAGNAVLLKHSSKTPLCGQAFVDAFQQAGAPAGLVQNIVAGHEITAKLIQHPKVAHVSFTGSVTGGHEVVQSAAGRFIETGLELGGKDPAYVCADADFDFAVENCVDGAFYNAGQSCCAIERIYVERAIYEPFVEAYAAAVRGYVMGDPMEETTTLGPLASSRAPSFLRGQIEEAVAAGDKLVVDPAEFTLPGGGWFSAPAVVAGDIQQTGLMQEESFGPVVGIVPVDGEEEAAAMMNDSAYGLSASIWTSDEDRARRVGPQVQTGTFFMNRCDYLDPALPWTGVKDTGRGATLSQYGLLQLTQLKSMHLRTVIPK